MHSKGPLGMNDTKVSLAGGSFTGLPGPRPMTSFGALDPWAQQGRRLGVYALIWLLSLALLRESRRAVAHWGAFMALLCAGLVLAALRSEPRHWLPYNGTNAVTVIGFALMRRGTEQFMGLPAQDREQLAVLLPALALFGWLGPGPEEAPIRIVAASGLRAWILARTLRTVRPALASESGRASMLGIVGPGSLLVLVLVGLALRQGVAWSEPTEMQVNRTAKVALMLTYLGGSALFSFGFLTMVTQRLVAACAKPRCAMRSPASSIAAP